MKLSRRVGKRPVTLGIRACLPRLCFWGTSPYRVGKEIAWDTVKGQTDASEAAQFLGREYRKGWELPKV